MSCLKNSFPKYSFIDECVPFQKSMNAVLIAHSLVQDLNSARRIYFLWLQPLQRVFFVAVVNFLNFLILYQYVLFD